MTTEKPGHNFNIYSVKDELTGKFYNPIFVETEDEAKRWFTFVLNDNKIWKDNANMYTLYCLGCFNDRKGITTTETYLVVGGLSVKKED